MKSKPTYDFISDRMKSSTMPDTNDLWKEMSMILDHHMPEEKDKDRNILGYFSLSSISFLVGILITVLVSIYYIVSPDLSNSTGVTSMPKTNSSIIEDEENIVSTDTKKVEEPAENKKPVFNNTKENKLTTEPELPIVTQEHPAELQSPAIDMHSESADIAKTNQQNPILSPEQKTILSNIVINHPAVNNKKQFNADYTSVAAHKNAATEIMMQQMTMQQEPAVIDQMQQIPAIEQHKKLAISYYPQQELKREPITNSMSFSRNDLVSSASMKKINLTQQRRGFTAGIAINVNLPVSQQEMSTVNINGEKKSLLDYLPSAYVQYHFNNKLFIESEFQFISPQYTPQLQLASKHFDYTSNQYKENKVSLNKLYYLNIPVSVHYSPVKNLYLGAGVQYSYLKRTVLIDELCLWKKTGNQWKMTESTKTVKVKSNPGQEKKASRGNGNGNGGGQNPQPQPMAPVDTVAQMFRSSDWRFLFDASYYWKRFNLGMKFNMGMNNYIETEVNGNPVPVKDKNKSFQFYLRYNILDLRNKKEISRAKFISF